MTTARGQAIGQLIAAFAAAGAGRYEQLAHRLAHTPRCPLTRYLLGCEEWDRNRPATATRHFMIAYHADPRFGSAALLAFAGLVHASEPGDSLLAAMTKAWDEFRRPVFDQEPAERSLLDMFAEPPPVDGPVRPEFVRFWRLPIARLRSELRLAWSVPSP